MEPELWGPRFYIGYMGEIYDMAFLRTSYENVYINSIYHHLIYRFKLVQMKTTSSSSHQNVTCLRHGTAKT
jgi:hypothetical protein